jgi:pimeloyl-ACP methyl ester carboxylesterase
MGWAGTLRDHFVDCRGLLLHAVEWTGPSGRTILLHHGFLDQARSWDPVARVLSSRYRVIAVDARGHGDSGWVGQGGYYYFQDYVFDLADVLDALVEGPVILVGHSMGGMVCSLFSGAFPDRVRALASIEGAGPPGLQPTDAPALMREWISGVRKARSKGGRPMADLQEAAERLMLYNPRLSREFALHLAVQGTRRAGNGCGLVWKFDPLHRTRGPQPFYLEQAKAFWRRVAAPVLVVRGEQSPFRWQEEEDRENFSSVRRIEIPGAGHMVHHERADLLAEAVLAFLDSLPEANPNGTSRMADT